MLTNKKFCFKYHLGLIQLLKLFVKVIRVNFLSFNLIIGDFFAENYPAIHHFSGPFYHIAFFSFILYLIAFYYVVSSCYIPNNMCKYLF